MKRFTWTEGETSIEYPEKKSIMAPSALDRLGIVKSGRFIFNKTIGKKDH